MPSLPTPTGKRLSANTLQQAWRTPTIYDCNYYKGRPTPPKRCRPRLAMPDSLRLTERRLLGRRPLAFAEQLLDGGKTVLDGVETLAGDHRLVSQG